MLIIWDTHFENQWSISYSDSVNDEVESHKNGEKHEAGKFTNN